MVVWAVGMGEEPVMKLVSGAGWSQLLVVLSFVLRGTVGVVVHGVVGVAVDVGVLVVSGEVTGGSGSVYRCCVEKVVASAAVARVVGGLLLLNRLSASSISGHVDHIAENAGSIHLYLYE